VLQYRRRNSNIPLQSNSTLSVHLLLTYCNWSYPKSSHIDTQTLKHSLNSFQDRYLRYYLRIINETPKGLIYSFMKQEGLDINSLKDIYDTLSSRGFDLREFSEL